MIKTDIRQGYRTGSVYSSLLPVLCLCAALIALGRYVPYRSVNFIIGLAGLPVAVMGNRQPVSGRFYVPALLLLSLACLFPGNFLLYGGLCVLLVFFSEQLHGRLPFIALAMIGFMSPAAQYVATLFSFPLRLQLTKACGIAMSHAGMNVSVAGSLIIMNGREYSVDPACMGLKMVLTSLMCGMLLIAVLQYRYSRRLRVPWVMVVLCTVFLLNMVANMLRIATLVYFDIATGSILHEVTGLIYLAVYVLLPTAVLTGWLVRRYGHVQPEAKTNAMSGMGIAAQMLLPVLLLVASLRLPQADKGASVSLPEVKGYVAGSMVNGVCTYTSADALVYIKRTNGLLGAEHNPAMCWTGTGYRFAVVDEVVMGGIPVYTARLVKDASVLYTAWWYTNGRKYTTSQLQWRRDRLLGGHKYSIINVTASSQAMLEYKLKEIVRDGVFAAAL